MKKIFIGIFLSIFFVATAWEGVYSHDDDYDDDDDDYESHESFEAEEYLDINRKRTSFRYRAVNIEPVKNALYKQECSSCHLDYSRGMLPERSWRLLMQPDSLENHFEEVLVLDEKDRQDILNYLVAGSSEKSRYKISQKINKSIGNNETPTRISQVRYIRRQHEEIPDKYTIQNAKVRSLSQCSACHQRIGQGIIDEDEVYIPYEKLNKN